MKDGGYSGARALAELHGENLRSFLAEWRAAKALEFPPPVLPELPDEDAIANEADQLLEEILEAWRLPLWEQPLEAFVSGEHKAWWGTGYCVDAMLEHAVMHPLRHRWQLEKLMGQSGRSFSP